MRLPAGLVEPGTGSVSRRTQSGVPPGAFFSKKYGAVDAVGIADPGQRPVAQVRQQHRRTIRV